MAAVTWRRSSFCGAGGNNCVEVAVGDETVAVRNSQDPTRVLEVSRSEFAKFVAGLRRVSLEGAHDNIPG